MVTDRACVRALTRPHTIAASLVSHRKKKKKNRNVVDTRRVNDFLLRRRSRGRFFFPRGEHKNAITKRNSERIGQNVRKRSSY